MKKIALLFLALGFFQCTDDDSSEPETSVPTINVTTTNDLTQAQCVGATVYLNASLRTDDSVGISEVAVIKWGEEIYQEANFDLAAQNFSFEYMVLPSDYGMGPVLLDVLLLDNEGRTARGGISFEVGTEYAFRQPLVFAEQKWDLVENKALDALFDFGADLEIIRSSTPCGADCTEHVFSVKSDSDARYFKVPPNKVVTPFNLAMKEFDVLSILQGTSAVSEMDVFRWQQNGAGDTLQILENRFPFVILLPDMEEMSVIDLKPKRDSLVYAKKFAEAGGE